MNVSKLENLIRSGYGFLKPAGENAAIYENKFTGLWVLYDYQTENFRVLEG